jgi:predicted small lipoprotein YifL
MLRAMRGLPVIALLIVCAACGRSTPVRFPDVPPELTEPTPTEPTPPRPAPSPFNIPLPPPPPPPICQETAAERFTLPPKVRRPIDVLFVIDDSCSMENDQRALAENFQAFFGAFQANQVDFHLGVVTTDMDDPRRAGRLVAPYLTPATPDLDARFAAMVRPGILGSSIERGLLAAWSALDEPLASNENKGFLRADADLALVFLGDEDDQSNLDITFFGNWLENLKASTAITVGTIVVGRCTPGLVLDWRLVQFARRFNTHGITRLCTSAYADTLRSIAGRIVDSRCTVALRHALDELRRVRVTVNGQPATYRVDPPDGAFPFGSLDVTPCPEAGGVVELTYEDCFFP